MYCSWDTWDEVFERLAQIVVFLGCRNTGRKAGDKTRLGTSLPTNSDATLEQKLISVTSLNPGKFLGPEIIHEASVSKIVTFQQTQGRLLILAAHWQPLSCLRLGFGSNGGPQVSGPVTWLPPPMLGIQKAILNSKHRHPHTLAKTMPLYNTKYNRPLSVPFLFRTSALLWISQLNWLD